MNKKKIILSELNKTHFPTSSLLQNNQQNPLDLQYNSQKIPLKAIKTSPKPKFELGLIKRDLVVNKMPDLPLAVDMDQAYKTPNLKAETLKLENACRFRKVNRNQKARNEELAALYQ